MVGRGRPDVTWLSVGDTPSLEAVSCISSRCAVTGCLRGVSDGCGPPFRPPLRPARWSQGDSVAVKPRDALKGQHRNSQTYALSGSASAAPLQRLRRLSLCARRSDRARFTGLSVTVPSWVVVTSSDVTDMHKCLRQAPAGSWKTACKT